MYLFRHHLICHRAAHDVRLNEHNVCVFTSCARRWNCGLSKCWYWSRILFCRARAPQQLPGNFLNFPFTIILQNILFWWASHSQIILKFSLLCDIEMLLFLFFFHFHFALSLLPPPNTHMAWQWIHWHFPVPSSPVPKNNLVFSAFFEFEMNKSGPKIIWKRAFYFFLWEKFYMRFEEEQQLHSLSRVHKGVSLRNRLSGCW